MDLGGAWFQGTNGSLLWELKQYVFTASRLESTLLHFNRLPAKARGSCGRHRQDLGQTQLVAVSTKH
jgi:hypothetical protein